ncbi:MAG: hypothetical protein LBQ71_22245 [Hungatella sp.]|nr:hypothetical protein [Hungatella sp.]
MEDSTSMGSEQSIDVTRAGNNSTVAVMYAYCECFSESLASAYGLSLN